MPGLILNKNSFNFNGENYLQTSGTAMGTKMTIAFANIFMAKIETTVIQQSETKPNWEWRRYIDDIFSLWDSDKMTWINLLNKLTNSTLLPSNIRERDYFPRHTVVFRGERLKKESILDIKTHYKPTKTFHFRD